MRHIKNDDFQLVQIWLDKNLRLKDIASNIEKDDRAVSRHLKKYRVFKPVFKIYLTRFRHFNYKLMRYRNNHKY